VDGFEVLSWVRNHPEFASLPVNVLSGSGMKSDIHNARVLGARDFVVKPNNPAELVALVKSMKEAWLS
jgi:two-component system OmpR family response regulator